MDVKKTTPANGNTTSRLCHDCRSAEKALRAHYFIQGKMKEWKSMPRSKRTSLVIQNKFNKAKKGKAREIAAVESSSVRPWVRNGMSLRR